MDLGRHQGEIEVTKESGHVKAGPQTRNVAGVSVSGQSYAQAVSGESSSNIINFSITMDQAVNDEFEVDLSFRPSGLGFTPEQYLEEGIYHFVSEFADSEVMAAAKILLNSQHPTIAFDPDNLPAGYVLGNGEKMAGH